ncbi:MAG TPA: putative zinc-binding protein [Rhodocyclaceae bacterium]
MSKSTPDFSIEVEAVEGHCATGEKHAEDAIARGKTPVFSCEGPCIRGDIARLAANIVAREGQDMARACHAETFFVPHSGMARWVRNADRCIVIDGCFLKCNGRVLNKLIAPERIVHFDALPMHKKYSKVFLMDDVPEAERNQTARLVADRILELLKSGAPEWGCPGDACRNG